MADTMIQTCEECGANVFPEHVADGRAGRYDGTLLCAVCYSERSEVSQAADDSIGLIDDLDKPSSGMSKIRQLGGGATIGAAQRAEADESKLKRPTRVTGRGATRCRTFHAKLNESAIAYMNEYINEWIDGNDQIEIKFATSAIGVFEGKHADPNLIVTVFY